MKSKKLSDRWCYSMVLILYVVLVSVTSFFHEPWLDECQAWLIARDCSLLELLGERLHYEGHPALWFILLMPFAKLGFPFKETMFFLNLAFMLGGFVVLFRKAPFPRWIKCVLPFTYFLCYQYGVISRPYSMMFFAFCLMGLFFQKRNEKPLRFLLAQFLLCMSCAYGMVISAGVCIVWTVEIIRDNQYYKRILAAMRDRRAWYLFVFLLINVGMLICMLPVEEARALNDTSKTTQIERLMQVVYAFLVAPADATIYGYTMEYLIDYSCNFQLLFGAVLGTIMLGVLGYFAWKKHMLHYVSAIYVIFAVFGAFVYLSPHHIGIYGMLLLFFSWVICNEKTSTDVQQETVLQHIPVSLRKYAVLLVVFIVGQNFYWTGVSMATDIRYRYDFGQDVASFIQENGAEGDVWVINSEESLGGERMLLENSWFPVSVNAYFEENVFMNVQFAYASNSCASALSRYEGLAAEAPPKYVFLEGTLEDVYLDLVWNEDILGQYRMVEEYAVRRGFRGEPLMPSVVYIYQWFE